MDFKLILSLLVFVCWFSASSASRVGGGGRSFLGQPIHNNSNSVEIGKEAQAVLKSRLTTAFFPAVYIIVFAVGLPANGMAVWVFLFRTKKKHPSSIYMANLALADLLFVIWLPLKIAYHVNGNNWTYGEPLCKVLVSFFYGNMYCSILFITCLSIQRYWVVAHPMSLQRKNNKIAIGVSLAIWAFIWLSSTPLFLYDHTAKLSTPNITTCHDVNVKTANSENPFEYIRFPIGYFLFMGTVAFFIPCVVIIVAYFLLLKTLRESAEENSSKNRKKAVVLIVTVLVIFLVCFIPSNIMLVVHYALLSSKELESSVIDETYGFYISTLCLASLNSFLDPFVYYFVSEDFREHVKNTLLCRSSRTVERMRVSFSSMKYSKKSKSYVSESGTTQTSSC
nr:proteinase-activated receptor 2 [Nothobranchius furzeri]